MRTNSFIFLTTLINLVSIGAFAQCSITKTAIDSNTTYIAKAESIYRNKDLENGLLTAFFQLVVIQKGDNKDLLKFGCIAKVLASRPKSSLVPRQIVFLFDDSTEIALLAEDANLSQPMAGINQNQCNYQFSSREFLKFQSNKLQSITIRDTRLNEQIICQPFNGLIQEQANCIAKKL
ncbi:MAG: hypothetical protein H7Y13_09600 [Sphingobacteriaceae bacterium]|nr:hypothetical protein [Sphingobacteriaceae bacterium]